MHEFVTEQVSLYLADAIESMKSLDDSSFDLAIIDPPYGASTKANWTLTNNHSLAGFGGAWKLADHQWDLLESSQGFAFTLAWLCEVRRLVKPSGSFWVHATYHNAGFVNVACQLLGLEIINEVVWFKRNAFPNLSARRLTASHETIYWIHTGVGKREYRFNYEAAKEAVFPEDKLKERGKQLRTVWDVPNNKKREEIKYGAHPTQKPLRLIQRLLLIAGLKGGNLLVPFLGSGSEVVAGLQYGMRATGFEVNKDYFELACHRVKDQEDQKYTLQQKLLL